MPPTLSPLVSIIIPSYNAAKFICEAIDSALAQTYPEKEIVVVDDGSTDGTRETLTSYIQSGAISYYYQNNAGPSAARNLGIQKSRGEFIAFLDADDIYLPEKLEKQVGYLLDHPACGVSYCDIWHFLEDAPEKLFMNMRSRYTGTDTLGVLLRMNFMNPLMIVMRRSSVERGGLFDESYSRSEDWEYWIRLVRSGVQFCHLDGAPLAKYRIRRGGLSYGGKVKVAEKKTMLRIFHGLSRQMTEVEKEKYNIRSAVFRQRMKLLAAYFVNYVPPLQWLYEWLQKKRLASV